MNANDNEPAALEDLPQPEVRPPRRLSLIWLVPIVAALIGAGLVVKTILEKGPTITIQLASAEGLEAGKTKIKYKDVDVGKVEAIHLGDGLSYVEITARMVPEIEPYLTATTRFWVVRARVSAGEISGLGTLFSGAYIGMDPGKDDGEERHFIGLEAPPVVTLSASGRYFKLQASKLGSLKMGAPVYLRQIKVGQVVHYEMMSDGTAVGVQVFIQSPYHEQVNQNTRFWNASGLDVNVGPSGVHINTESILALIEGGIAFATPANLDKGGPVGDGHIFTLFESYDQIDEPTYARKFFFIAYFDETVRGLAIGAPVEFKGIKVGEVIDFKLEFNPKESSLRIPVLCAIEPDRIEIKGRAVDAAEASEEEEFAVLGRLVQKGLRAQLRTGVLLTGQLYVNLIIYPNAKPEELSFVGGFPILPTVPEPVQEITASFTNLLARLERLPIEQIGDDMRDTVGHAKKLMGSQDLASAIVVLNKSLKQLQRFAVGLNTDLAPQMGDVLKQTRQAIMSGQKAISAAEKVLSADAPLTYELNQTLKELSRAARAVNALADLLERNPQALIYGKGTPP